MWRRAVWQKFTEVSESPAFSIISVISPTKLHGVRILEDTSMITSYFTESCHYLSVAHFSLKPPQLTKSKGPTAVKQQIQYFENQHPAGIEM